MVTIEIPFKGLPTLVHVINNHLVLTRSKAGVFKPKNFQATLIFPEPKNYKITLQVLE